MILRIVDCFRKHFRNVRSLSWYHWAAILVTVFAPVILGLVFAYPAFESLVARVIVYVGAFLFWALIVVVVAKLAEHEDSVVRTLMSQRTEPLENQVNSVREEQGSLIEDLRSQLEDLEKRTRATFTMLDVNLPPRSVRLRGGATSGVPEVSAALSQSGGSRWRRFWRMVRREMAKLRKGVYGK